MFFLQINPEDFGTVTIAIIVGAVFLFIVAREFFLWYWKINEQLKQNKEQSHLQKEQLRLMTEVAQKMGVDVEQPNLEAGNEDNDEETA